jgi:hypothetical protein
MLNKSGQLRLVVATHPFTSRSTLSLRTHLWENTPPAYGLRSEGARPPATAALPFSWRGSTAVLPTLHITGGLVHAGRDVRI